MRLYLVLLALLQRMAIFCCSGARVCLSMTYESCKADVIDASKTTACLCGNQMVLSIVAVSGRKCLIAADLRMPQIGSVLYQGKPKVNLKATLRFRFHRRFKWPKPFSVDTIGKGPRRVQRGLGCFIHTNPTRLDQTKTYNWSMIPSTCGASGVLVSLNCLLKQHNRYRSVSFKSRVYNSYTTSGPIDSRQQVDPSFQT